MRVTVQRFKAGTVVPCALIRLLERSGAAGTHQRGKRVRGTKLRVPAKVDVKAVRRRTGLTQQFAAKFSD